MKTPRGPDPPPPGSAEDPVWRALSDPTRRRILEELREGAMTTGKLVRGFQMSRFGVMKHLRVLERAGLVRVESRGRERWNHLDPTPILTLYQRWIRPFEEPPARSGQPAPPGQP